MMYPLKSWIRAYRVAFKRKLALATRGVFDPYLPLPAKLRLSPSLDHFSAYRSAPLKLSRKKTGGDARAWQRKARAKLAELIGYAPADAAASVVHQSRGEISPRGLTRTTFYLRVGPERDVPVHLLRAAAPESSSLPVLIYLAGSTSGVHVGWGDVREPADALLLGIGADMARQATERGYAVACIEQACFGERLERNLSPRSPGRSIDAANHALLLGRTLVGERVMDVSAVVDWITSGGAGVDLDRDRVHIFGHSSGGATALHAAALDTRLSTVIVSGCVGYIRDTIAVRQTSEGETIVPGILNWLETDDIVALCAPRPFVAVSGRADHIFPFDGLQAVIESARLVYRELGAEAAVRAVPCEGPHRYYADATWAALAED